MKRIVLLIAIISQISCDSNDSPRCLIIEPLDNDTYVIGEKININIESEDPDGTISEVRLYLNDIGIVELASFPFHYQISTLDYPVEKYAIKVVATDNEGKKAEDNISLNIELDVADIEGNEYSILKIESQIWMIENLRTTKHPDGLPIQLIEDQAEWIELEDKDQGYCWYNNDESNRDEYGALYNWSAATNGYSDYEDSQEVIQGVCPDGWHIPSDNEWMMLERFLGMSEKEMEKLVWASEQRGNNEGGKMKRADGFYWTSPNIGATNESGFSALPGGGRNRQGFFGMKDLANFWSSTKYFNVNDNKTYIVYRQLYSGSQWIGRHLMQKKEAASIRCIKD